VATNPYFNYYTQHNEQSLLEDLTVESIRQFAHNVVYLPRNINIEDPLMVEPITQSFQHALDVEMYIKNWDNYQGEGQLLSKFGLEIREQMTFVLTHRSFNQFIKNTTHKPRPWEGDCIYIPMIHTVYQIKYVDSSASFFQLGKNYSWEIVSEILEFNNEKFETGRVEIDKLNPPFEHVDDPNYNLDDYDKTAQNTVIQDEGDNILDWTESNPFGEV